MGLLDAAVGTVVSGYVAVKLVNRVLEKVFFARRVTTASKGNVPWGNLVD